MSIDQQIVFFYDHEIWSNFCMQSLFLMKRRHISPKLCLLYPFAVALIANTSFGSLAACWSTSWSVCPLEWKSTIRFHQVFTEGRFQKKRTKNVHRKRRQKERDEKRNKEVSVIIIIMMQAERSVVSKWSDFLFWTERFLCSFACIN